MCGNGAEDENRRKKRKRSQLKDKVQRFTFAENSEITRVSVIAQDRYFKNGVSICTADQPDAIDHEAFKDAVMNEMRAPHPIIVIVEGFRAFQDERLDGCFDVMIWIDVMQETSFRRRRSPKVDEDVFNKNIWPMHIEYQRCVEKRLGNRLHRLDGDGNSGDVLEVALVMLRVADNLISNRAVHNGVHK